MKTTHELKTWPEHFKAILSGKKKCEIRKHDRAFKVNDLLLLREYDPETEKYTGTDTYARITHILKGGQFGIEEGYCALSIEH